jgi:hypothetical protein
LGKPREAVSEDGLAVLSLNEMIRMPGPRRRAFCFLTPAIAPPCLQQGLP